MKCIYAVQRDGRTVATTTDRTSARATAQRIGGFVVLPKQAREGPWEPLGATKAAEDAPTQEAR